ncbi:pectin lyase fold/virulence factor, partial [Jimgerdemannia flammicorona]
MQLRIAAIFAAFLATAAVAGNVEVCIPKTLQIPMLRCMTYLFFCVVFQNNVSCIATSYNQIPVTKNCTEITIRGPFTVPANSKIDLTGLITGTKIVITGEITFTKGTLDKTNDLVTIGGSDITIDGSKGIFYGSGPDYWDGKGSNGGINKPKFIRLKNLSGTIEGLTVKGSPIHTFAISGCTGLTLSGITIDN